MSGYLSVTNSLEICAYVSLVLHYSWCVSRPLKGYFVLNSTRLIFDDCFCISGAVTTSQVLKWKVIRTRWLRATDSQLSYFGTVCGVHLWNVSTLDSAHNSSTLAVKQQNSCKHQQNVNFVVTLSSWKLVTVLLSVVVIWLHWTVMRSMCIWIRWTVLCWCFLSVSNKCYVFRMFLQWNVVFWLGLDYLVSFMHHSSINTMPLLESDV